MYWRSKMHIFNPALQEVISQHVANCTGSSVPEPRGQLYLQQGHGAASLPPTASAASEWWDPSPDWLLDLLSITLAAVVMWGTPNLITSACLHEGRIELDPCISGSYATKYEAGRACNNVSMLLHPRARCPSPAGTGWEIDKPVLWQLLSLTSWCHV